MKYKLVKVKWIDISGDISWKTVKEAKEWAKKECICLTIGWLLEKNADYLLMAATNDSNEKDMEFNDLSRIPISNVKKITIIKDA